MNKRLNELDKNVSSIGKDQRKNEKTQTELRNKLKSLKTELESKLSDAEDEILNELEKVKLLAETVSTHTEVEASIPLGGGGVSADSSAAIGSSGGYSNPADAFKVRNQIQEMWKSLRLDIAHRKPIKI